MAHVTVGVDEYVDPAQSTPKGVLCATGGCYPPLRFERENWFHSLDSSVTEAGGSTYSSTPTGRSFIHTFYQITARFSTKKAAPAVSAGAGGVIPLLCRLQWQP